ncbi:MAG TPA: hypothetical protein VF593_04080, partial [Chthoniobacteraceae bacterium]
DETRAVALFKEGMRLGDGNSMYFLGLCYQDGRGGLKQNPEEARQLCKKAAEAGSKPAQDWCRQNGIALGTP